MARGQETRGGLEHGGSRYWFGPFSYDPSLASLRRGEEEISLPPRALDLLEHLLQRPGEVVGKDELLEAVWEGRIVGEESLTQAISVIRHALDDDPQEPTHIRTVPRRGYLFLSEVRHGPEPNEGGKGAMRSWLIAAGVLVLLAGIAGYWLTQKRHLSDEAMSPGDEQTVATSERTRIAVLLFENLGPDEDSYFAAGITEEVTSRLASVSSLGVVSSKTARRYAESERDIGEIGEKLDVEYILEGAVRWAKSPDGPDRVRITPRLVRVEDDRHLWAEVYDREVKDIFALQTEIAAKVLAELGVRLADVERQVVESRPTANLEAYHAYLRAREIHDMLGDYGVAAQLYERATQLDPEFADAYAYLSFVKADRYRRGVARTAADLAVIQKALERAAALGPERFLVRMAQGNYFITCEQDYDQALEVFRSLAEDFPNLEKTQRALGHVYLRQGRFEEAVVRYERARALQPESLRGTGALAHIYRGLRKFDAAEQLFNRVIDMSPNFALNYGRKAENLLAWKGDLARVRDFAWASPPHFEVSKVRFTVELAEGNHEAAIAVMRQAVSDPTVLEGPWQEVDGRFRIGFALHLSGRLDEARAELYQLETKLEELLEQQPQSNFYPRHLARVYTLLGKEPEAIQVARQVVERSGDDRWFGPRIEETLAFVYAWSGQPEAALEVVERLMSVSYKWSLTASRLALEAEWTPLRKHPRYQALLEKYGQDVP